MASIKLTGDTSGEITISAPAVAGTNTLTLPASTGNILTDGAVANNGIYLGGTASANLLDDYEEGTWTPALLTGNTTTYNFQVGNYTKIGNMVYMSYYVNASFSTATGTSSVRLEGLPFSIFNPRGVSGSPAPLSSTCIVLIGGTRQENMYASPYSGSEPYCYFYYTNSANAISGNQTNNSSFVASGNIIARVA